jgi:hypothetical protein
MSHIQFNLAKYSYPSLESNYYPNLTINSRVQRYFNSIPEKFVANNDPIFKTIGTALNTSTSKINIVHLNLDASGVFNAYINNLLGCSSITAELIVAIDISTNTNVNPIIQPTVSYNKANGYLTLTLTPEYDNYMLTFLVTGLKQNNLTMYVEAYYKPSPIPSFPFTILN